MSPSWILPEQAAHGFFKPRLAECGMACLAMVPDTTAKALICLPCGSVFPSSSRRDPSAHFRSQLSWSLLLGNWLGAEELPNLQLHASALEYGPFCVLRES